MIAVVTGSATSSASAASNQNGKMRLVK